VMRQKSDRGSERTLIVDPISDHSLGSFSQIMWAPHLLPITIAPAVSS
jgi:hypothetical protein